MSKSRFQKVENVSPYTLFKRTSGFDCASGIRWEVVLKKQSQFISI